MNGDWNVLLGRTDIVNLSVAGSRAADWKARAQENLALIPPNVTKVIIQFGKNDIDAETPPEVITQNIQDIVTLIETTRAIKVGVLAPLPVTATKAGMEYTNPKTKKLLPYLEKIHATYYEGYETLVIDGVLLPRYTDDGSHLNAAGKAIYKDTITALEAKL